MNLLLENKKNYFIVMITELIMLSCIYWFFFTFCFSSLLVYLLSISFYIMGYIFWLQIFKEQKHLLIDNSEHFLLFNIIALVIILAINSLLSPQLISMFFVFITTSVIFICYYIFRLKKQKKSNIAPTEFCGTYKFISVMCSVFLLFDLVVWFFDRMSVQLILYMPVLFGIFTLLIFIYKKEFCFNSLFPAILFFNIYILSSTLLIFNYMTTNFFTFMIIIHFIIMTSIFNLFMANSKTTENNELLYRKNIMSLLFVNIVLIFICLNSILLFQLPEIILSYLYFITIIFICYNTYYNYKIS
jgi:hypothetical protein